MESREFQNYDDEMTIDLAHFAISIVKKWKSLVALVLIGAVLGGGWQFLSSRGASPIAAPAEVTPEMQVAAVYRQQYEKLQSYIENSPFMELNSEAVVIGESSYYVSAEEDVERIFAYVSAILNDNAVRESLCEILEIEDEIDLDKMVLLEKEFYVAPDKSGAPAVEKVQSAAANLTVYAQSQEQAQQALDLLSEAVTACEKAHGFKLEQTSQDVRLGSSLDLRDAQVKLNTELNNAYKNFIALETKFSGDAKATYEVYLETGDVSSHTITVPTDNPLKKPILVAVVLAFLGCAWYAVAYLLSGKVKTVDEAVSLTRKNVLGFINEAAPRKCFIDRWLDGLEGRSFPTPVSPSYAAAAVAKLGQAVVVYDEDNADLKAVAQKMGGIASMGLIGQNADTLTKLDQQTQVVLLVKLGTTTKMQLEREAALCRQYGVKLAGSILIR